MAQEFPNPGHRPTGLYTRRFAWGPRMNGWLQRLISSFRWIVGPLLALWVGTRWGVPVGLGVLALFVLGPRWACCRGS